LNVDLSFSDPLAGQMLDVPGIDRVVSEVIVGGSDLPVDSGSSPVSLEPHSLMFYTVNDFGFISEDYYVSVRVVAIVTDTPTESAHAIYIFLM
jgi:hypothetical protein